MYIIHRFLTWSYLPSSSVVEEIPAVMKSSNCLSLPSPTGKQRRSAPCLNLPKLSCRTAPVKNVVFALFAKQRIKKQLTLGS